MDFKGFCPITVKFSLLKSLLIYEDLHKIHIELGFASFFTGGLPLPSVLKKDMAVGGIFESDPTNQQELKGEGKMTVNTI